MLTGHVLGRNLFAWGYLEGTPSELPEKGEDVRSAGRLHLLALPLLVGGVLSASAAAAPDGTSGGCVVPQLKGTPLAVVKQLLPLLHCRIGTVTRRPSTSIDAGALIATRPKAGRHAPGTAIDLTVSRGTAPNGPAVAAAGRGTNDDPYTGSCSAEVEGSCVVNFDRRHLRSFLANEYVPAYRCPPATRGCSRRRSPRAVSCRPAFSSQPTGTSR